MKNPPRTNTIKNPPRISIIKNPPRTNIIKNLVHRFKTGDIERTTHKTIIARVFANR